LIIHHRQSSLSTKNNSEGKKKKWKLRSTHVHDKNAEDAARRVFGHNVAKANRCDNSCNEVKRGHVLHADMVADFKGLHKEVHFICVHVRVCYRQNRVDYMDG